MGEEKKLVQQYELKQKELKQENLIYKRRIPYYLFGFIFFAIGLIALLDGKLNHCVGNSVNLIVIVIGSVGLISIVYLFIIYFKIKNNTKEIKALGTKVYKLMKL